MGVNKPKAAYQVELRKWAEQKSQEENAHPEDQGMAEAVCELFDKLDNVKKDHIQVDMAQNGDGSLVTISLYKSDKTKVTSQELVDALLEYVMRFDFFMKGQNE